MKLPLFLLFFFTCSVIIAQDDEPMGEVYYTTMGPVLSVEQGVPNAYSVQISCENGKVRLSFLKENIIRVHMAPKNNDFPEDTYHEGENGPYAVVKYDWSPGVRYQLKEDANTLNISAGELVVNASKSPFHMKFYDRQGNLLVQEREGSGLGYQDSTVYETMELPDDEHFFGFGAYRKSREGNNFDKRGNSMVCDPSELGEGDRGGGFPTPWLMSSKGYGIYFDNLDDDVTLNMGTTPYQYSFHGTSGGKCGWDMDYYLIYGPKFSRILQNYIEITGKPVLPEKWFMGIIQSNCCDADDEFMRMQADSIRNGHYPVDGLVYDFYWRVANEGFEWSKEGRGKFPDHVATNKYLLSKNFKIEYHENVHFTISPGMCDCCSFSQMIDVTNPKQVNCYWDLHKPIMDEGARFWRQDNSERFIGYSPFNGYDMGSIGGMLYAKTVFEGAARDYNIHMPVVSRAGPMGGHRYISAWPGDVYFGLEKLDTDLDYIRDGGLSGYVSIGADLGGFSKGPAYDLEENMYRRVIQMFLVYPILRIHGAGKEGWKFPWMYDKNVQDLYKFYARLRYRLHPYVYSAAIGGHLTGRPILAPLLYDYQDDVNTYKTDYQFMFGKNILVAPVLKSAETWDVYLPAGDWIHYWTGKEYHSTGQTFKGIAAPMKAKEGLPMFVKKGAIIPMMPEMEWIFQKSPDPITLDIYPLNNASSKAVAYDCKTPVSAIDSTGFECSDSQQEIRINISPSKSNYVLVVHNDNEPASVTVDGKSLKKLASKSTFESAGEGWYFGDGCFSGASELKTINVKFGNKSGKMHSIIIRKK